MKFLVDQNLPTGLVAVLEAMGHDASHIKARGLAEASDENLWQLAADEGRVMVSKDADFVNLVRRSATGQVLRLTVGNCSNIELYEIVRSRLPPALARLTRGERHVEISV